MAARILVIEDNEANLDLMTYLLDAFGYTPLRARSGEEGLETAVREAPDLVVCDVHLTGIGGYEVSRRLRQDPAFDGVPFVAVTAFAMVGDRDKVLAGGFDGYIPKPIDPESFVAQVEAFLPPARRASRSQKTPVAGTRSDEDSPAPTRRPRILVVDDNAVNVSLDRCILEPFGYEIVDAGGVEDGLAAAGRLPPDLILCDVHLADGTGFDLFSLVKADPRLAAVPFALTSSSLLDEAERARARALGATTFILRPLESRAFLAEVEACLRPHGGS